MKWRRKHPASNVSKARKARYQASRIKRPRATNTEMEERAEFFIDGSARNISPDLLDDELRKIIERSPPMIQ